MSIKKMTLLRKLTCTIGDQCPAIEHVEGGGFRVTGTNVDDPANEATVEVPDSLLPELASLEIRDWPQWLKAHRKTPGDMLRIQTLDHYGVSSDDQDYLGYLNGAPAPISPYREPWFQQLRDERGWSSASESPRPLYTDQLIPVVRLRMGLRLQRAARPGRADP